MSDDPTLDRRAVDAPDQLHVELDDVRLELRQKVQTREPGTEIVDCGREPKLPVGLQDAEQVVRVDPLGLSELEHDPVDGEARASRRIQREADAGVGIVDRVR